MNRTKRISSFDFFEINQISVQIENITFIYNYVKINDKVRAQCMIHVQSVLIRIVLPYHLITKSRGVALAKRCDKKKITFQRKYACLQQKCPDTCNCLHKKSDAGDMDN